MLLLFGILGLVIGVWFGRKWRNYKIYQLIKLNNKYKRITTDALNKAKQLTEINKVMMKEIEFHRKAIKIKEINEMKMGVVDAMSELTIGV